MTDAFICDFVRTPIGRYAGALKDVRTDDLAAHPLRVLRARHAGVDWAAVDASPVRVADRNAEAPMPSALGIDSHTRRCSVVSAHTNSEATRAPAMPSAAARTSTGPGRTGVSGTVGAGSWLSGWSTLKCAPCGSASCYRSIVRRWIL